MAYAADLVTKQFELAQNYASAAQQQMSNFASTLNGSFYTPAKFNHTWKTPDLPTPEPPPKAPDPVAIDFNSPMQPSPLPMPNVSISIDDFTEVAPTVNVPTAPTLNYGTTPAIPAISNVEVPDAPALDSIPMPTYLGLSTPTFGGVDLHQDYLDKLSDIPTLNMVEPTPYRYVAGPEYASQLLDNLKAVLNERIKGGTGLSPAVEQAIWDRARDRETQLGLANEAEIMRSSEALGFHLPTGALATQLREAQQNYYDKLSGLSRDVSVKQAELEQENLKQTISAGMQLEAQLIDYSYKLEQLTFEEAKAAAETSIQAYNAQVERFKALLAAYNTYAASYKTVIDAEMTKVEVYKAQLQGEQTKAQINQTLVEQYKAQIESAMSRVEIYKAQVGAANARIGMEQAKIAAAGEQIKAYVAQVNAETAKVEAFKASVQAEATKVDIYRTKAQVFSAKAGAQAEKARAQISMLSAVAQTNEAMWRGYTAMVEGERTRITALSAQSTAKLDAYRINLSAAETKNALNAKIWESTLRQYEAEMNLSLQTAKLNADSVQFANNARLEAAKAGTQVYAQLTSSAYGMMHTSAGVSYSQGISVGYSYGGEVNSPVNPMTNVN